MRRDHEASLNTALDQLFLQGSTSILWQHLYLWYNTERITKRVYGDIMERWQSLCDEYEYTEDVPEIEAIQNSDTWMNLCRGLFKDEKRVPLSELS